jgi:hypothetical protein
VALRKSAATLIANPLIDLSNGGAPRPSETRSAAPPTQSATAQASGHLGDAGSRAPRAPRMPLWVVGVIVVVSLAILAAGVFLFLRFRHRSAVAPATNAATSNDRST